MSIRESQPIAFLVPFTTADIRRLNPAESKDKEALVANLRWAQFSLEEVGIGLLPSDIVGTVPKLPTPQECFQVIMQHYPECNLSPALRDILIVISTVNTVWENTELQQDKSSFEMKKTYRWKAYGL